MAKFSDADPDDPESKTAFGAPRCQAANAAGDRCGKPALRWGVGLCDRHGGNLPNNVSAQEQNRLTHEARKLLGTFVTDPTPVSDPVAELALMAGQGRSLRDYAFSACTPRNACNECGRDETDPAAYLAWNLVAKSLTTMLTQIDKIGLRDRIIEHNAQALTVILAALNDALCEVYPDVEEKRILLQDRLAERIGYWEAHADDLPGTIRTQSRGTDPGTGDHLARTVPVSPDTDDWLG